MLNRTRINQQYLREFLRVPYPSIVSISTDDETYINYKINDLSGGGISFFSYQEKYRIGDRLKGQLFINQNTITFYAKVVRVEEERISAAFIWIKENDRSKVVQECNRQQLKYRK